MREQESSEVRLRAAPSPTGYVHIGNLRTFLYNYLFVKKNDGKYILRIEDTDQKRKVEGGMEAIIEVLRLYGILFDESPEQGGDYGPYIQTERRDIYLDHADKLVKEGFAYHCFCTPERLDKMRQDQHQQGLPTRYDGKCRDLSEEEIAEKLDSGEKHVIRMKFPNEGITKINDLVYGEVSIPNNSIDDQVIIKADGLPTYHFAVVVDDHLMGITHVVRGREYLADTPKNLFLYEAFDWEIPVYIHVPHILKPSGPGKLGKRDGALPAFGYLKKGYLPEAILNYIALIGWSPDPKKAKQSEIYSIDELVEIFDPKGIQKSGGRYDPKKLENTAGKHIREFQIENLQEKIFKWAEQIVLADQIEGIEKEKWEEELELSVSNSLPMWKDDLELFRAALQLVNERMTHFAQLPELLQFFYKKELSWELEGWNMKNHTPAELAAALEGILPQLDKIFHDGDFKDHDNWEKMVRDHADQLDWKHGDLFMAIRSAVTGSTKSPPLLESMEVLGWKQSRKNIEDGIAWLKEEAS